MVYRFFLSNIVLLKCVHTVQNSPAYVYFCQILVQMMIVQMIVQMIQRRLECNRERTYLSVFAKHHTTEKFPRTNVVLARW